MFVLGGVLSIPITFGLVRLLAGFVPALPFALNLNLTVTWRVAAFAMALACMTAIIFGLAPARHALGADVAPLLRGTQATADRVRLRLRHALVGIQVALSLMLVVTAFLFLRTLQHATRVDPGFRVAAVTLASVNVGLSGFRDAAAVDVVERLRARLAGLNGVTSVAASRMIPLQGSGFALGRVRVPGFADALGHDTVDADWNVVSPEYFATVGMRVVDGRGFRATDRSGTVRVGIVNETFARMVWPGRPAVGQRILQEERDGVETAVEIVGVAADAKYRYLNEAPTPFLYVPLAQQPVTDVTFFVAHAGRPPTATDLRAVVAQVEPTIPILFAQSFEDAVTVGLTPQRLTAWIAGSVGTLGIGLAALGVYGLMAFVVAQRTREIAIRVALGASAAQMQTLVFGQAARLLAIGAAVGLCLAWGVGVLLRGLLVGVAPVDPLSSGLTLIVFAAVVLAASWVPARRAATTAPAAALRAE